MSPEKFREIHQQMVCTKPPTSPLVNPPPRGSDIDPQHNARNALALVIDSVLGTQSRYAIVTFDKRGKLVIFDVDEYDGPRNAPQKYDIVVEPFRADLNTIKSSHRAAGLFSTSLKQAEKRRTAVVKWLREMKSADYDSDDPEYYLSNVRCVELVTIIKLNTTAVAIHPVKKSKGTK